MKINLFVSALLIGFAAAATGAASSPDGQLDQYNVEHLRNHRKLITVDSDLRIEGEYIVAFEPFVDVNEKISTLKDSLFDGLGDNGILFEFRETLHGIACNKLTAIMLQFLLNDPDIAFIEENQIFEMYQTRQADATWGLDRLDQAGNDLDGGYTIKYTGEGVTAFIVDTGIYEQHDEFSDRVTSKVTCGFTATTSEEGCVDGQGHGTHVAGTVGGKVYGVAKDVNLVAVKVLGSSGVGSTAGIIAGVEYIKKQKMANPDTPMVANMSLGGLFSQATNDAVESAVDAGVFFAIAAGNSRLPARFFSPASANNVVTVGATTTADRRASFSNWGDNVDIFAPGQSITSAWNDGPSSTLTISGTSMASPHVAGVAALILEADPSLSPAEVKAIMLSDAVAVVRGKLPRSPDLLLQLPSI